MRKSESPEEVVVLNGRRSLTAKLIHRIKAAVIGSSAFTEQRKVKMCYVGVPVEVK